MSNPVSLENFKTLLHKKFNISDGDAHKQEVLLTEIVEFERGAFSLLFKADPAAKLLKDGIYTLSHEDLGEFQLTIFTKAPDAEGNYYEVNFN